MLLPITSAIAAMSRSPTALSSTAIGALEITRECREGAESPVGILEHQEDHAEPDRQREEDVEVIAPGIPGAASPQKRVVEMVQAPEKEGNAEQHRGARAGLATEPEKDP